MSREKKITFFFYRISVFISQTRKYHAFPKKCSEQQASRARCGVIFILQIIKLELVTNTILTTIFIMRFMALLYPSLSPFNTFLCMWCLRKLSCWLFLSNGKDNKKHKSYETINRMILLVVLEWQDKSYLLKTVCRCFESLPTCDWHAYQKMWATKLRFHMRIKSKRLSSDGCTVTFYFFFRPPSHCLVAVYISSEIRASELISTSMHDYDISKIYISSNFVVRTALSVTAIDFDNNYQVNLYACSSYKNRVVFTIVWSLRFNARCRCRIRTIEQSEWMK